MTIAFGAMEFIVTPETTYIAPGGGEPLRRIYTDGRDWPTDLDPAPTYAGYSIGRWIDEDGDGVYDVLEVEPACRFISTTSPSSRNASSATKTIRRSCTT